MLYRIAADAVVLFHVAFVTFVVFGGLLVARWPRLMWAHLPAAAWGAVIEFAGWICPLTPIENELRYRAGMAEYSGDFVGHYVLPVLYPDDLTRGVQLVLGAIVVAVNATAYWRLVRMRASSCA